MTCFSKLPVKIFLSPLAHLEIKIIEVRCWCSCQRCRRNEIVNTFGILNFTDPWRGGSGISRKMRDWAFQTNFPTSKFCRLRLIVNINLFGFARLSSSLHSDCGCGNCSFSRHRTRRKLSTELSKSSVVAYSELQPMLVLLSVPAFGTEDSFIWIQLGVTSTLW